LGDISLTMLKIIQNRKIFFFISGILVAGSILSLIFWGLNLGIDFTGGSLLEVEVKGKMHFSTEDVSAKIKKNLPEIGEVRVQPTESGFIIRMRDLSEEEHQKVVKEIKKLGNKEIKEEKPETRNQNLEENRDDKNLATQQFNNSTTSKEAENFEKDDSQQEILSIQEKRFESIGPIIGQELKTKAIWAIGIALVVIILYIAWAFRKVSKPVASWKYGMGAIVALIHDILIVTGVFSVLGHFLGYEVGILFVTALLTILGYSVNDTIVVYDRTRENLIYNPQDTFENTVNKSVNETIARSINTGLTTLFVLLALYFLGGETIKSFVLTLMIGTVVGTYSSIFIASPLLVVWQKLSKR